MLHVLYPIPEDWVRLFSNSGMIFVNHALPCHSYPQWLICSSSRMSLMPSMFIGILLLADIGSPGREAFFLSCPRMLSGSEWATLGHIPLAEYWGHGIAGQDSSRTSAVPKWEKMLANRIVG